MQQIAPLSVLAPSLAWQTVLKSRAQAWGHTFVSHLQNNRLLQIVLLITAVALVWKLSQKKTVISDLSKPPEAPIKGAEAPNPIEKPTKALPSPVVISLFDSSNNGSWIGEDKEHSFGSHLQWPSGELIVLPPDAFYLIFQVKRNSADEDEIELIYLPSPLFENKKGGDTVEYRQDGDLHILKLKNGFKKPFETQFAEIKTYSQTIRPGTGNYTYRVKDSRPVGALHIHTMDLSPHARRWDFEEGKIAELTQVDCRRFERVINHDNQCQAVKSLTHESTISIPLYTDSNGVPIPINPICQFTLIVDVGCLLFAVKKPTANCQGVEIYSILKLPKLIDPRTIQVDTTLSRRVTIQHTPSRNVPELT